MLQKILLFFLFIALAIVALNRSLDNGSYRTFLDEHPSPSLVPPVAYVTGQSYYLFHNLTEAATYFTRITERYPQSSYADDAAYYYALCMDEAGMGRQPLVEIYNKYLELYPKGGHALMVRNRIDTLAVSGR